MKKARFQFLALAAVFALLPNVAFAATRYVALTGSDDNAGTSAEPFRTIQKCATASASGDVCAINAGTYREQVIPPSGVTFQPVSGASVTVSGADFVTGWSLYSGNIYKASVAATSGLDANQLFQNGVMMEEARWPNTGTDVMKPNWAIMDSGSNSTTIVDSAMQNINWTGATAKWWAGTNPYGQLSATVTGSTAGSVTFTAPWPSRCPFLCPTSGGKFYLVGKLAALDAEREWFFDGSTLYFWQPGGGSPVNVQMKRRNWAFDLSGRTGVTIRGLKIYAAGIRMDASSANNLIENIEAQYIAHYIRHNDGAVDYIKTGDLTRGILLKGSGNIFRNSTIQFSAGSGVVVDGNNQTVTNNLIRNVNYGGNYGAGVFIRPFGTGHTVTYNTIAKLGRAGITISGNNSDTGEYLTNSTIAYNNVFGHNMMSVDSAAIYICCQVDGTGTVVRNNWAYDDRNLSDEQGFKSYGIYYDNSSKAFDTNNNLMWKNFGGGVKVHGEGQQAPDFLIRNNTVYDGNESIYFAKVSSSPGTYVEDNLVREAPTISATAAQGAVIQNNTSSAPGATIVTVGCNIAAPCTDGETPPAW